MSGCRIGANGTAPVAKVVAAATFAVCGIAVMERLHTAADKQSFRVKLRCNHKFSPFRNVHLFVFADEEVAISKRRHRVFRQSSAGVENGGNTGHFVNLVAVRDNAG